jgi:hypothetical protein
VTDFTMPVKPRLDPRAYIKSEGFGQVCRIQDEIAHGDDVQRRANRVQQVACTRKMLDMQLAEIQKKRVRLLLNLPTAPHPSVIPLERSGIMIWMNCREIGLDEATVAHLNC